MQCTRPIKIDGGPPVPCRKCRACRIARARTWAVRILHEMAVSDSAAFVTLTYREEDLPFDLSLSKRAFVLFMKRLRKELAPRKVRYFACGEYGEKRGRPHYHVILFNVSLRDKPVIEQAWPCGFVHMGSVTYDSARYVADYLQKDDRREKWDDREPPFSLKSQGLGRDYIDNVGLDGFTTMGYIRIRGVDLEMPRYYKQRLGIATDAYLAGRYEHDKREEDLLAESGQSKQEMLQALERDIDARERLKQERKNVQW